MRSLPMGSGRSASSGMGAPSQRLNARDQRAGDDSPENIERNPM